MWDGPALQRVTTKEEGTVQVVRRWCSSDAVWRSTGETSWSIIIMADYFCCLYSRRSWRIHSTEHCHKLTNPPVEWLLPYVCCQCCRSAAGIVPRDVYYYYSRRKTTNGISFFSFFISKLTKNQLLALLVKDRLNKSFVVHQVYTSLHVQLI